MGLGDWQNPEGLIEIRNIRFNVQNEQSNNIYEHLYSSGALFIYPDANASWYNHSICNLTKAKASSIKYGSHKPQGTG